MPLMFLLLLALSSFAGVPETGLLTSRTISGQAYGTPLFSNQDEYNEYDFCRSPLGIFEKESCMVRCGLEYRTFSIANTKSADSGSASANDLEVPRVIVGKRDVIYLILDYDPSWVSQKSNDTTLLLSPLHRFGLTVAAEMPSKYMRFGITGQGYYGTLTTSLNKNERTIMGLSALSAYLGSQVHPLVRIGIHGGATANFDSLQDKANIQVDRYFYGAIPSYGGDIDVGMKGVPLQSSFNIDFATNNLVYVTKGIPPVKPDGSEDALVGDSLAWQWRTIGTIAHAGFEYRPALSLEYWRDKIQEYTPGEKNYPLQYGSAQGDTNWTFSSFSLGLGASSRLQTYGKTWFEYTHEFFNASYGAGTNRANRKQGYDRIGLGLEGNVNSIPGLRMPESMEAFLRLGYLNMRENARFGGYHADEFRQIGPMAARSQFAGTSGAYSLAFGQDERVSRFSLGAGGTFFNRMLGVDLMFAFLSREADVKENGFEFGIGVEYVMKAGK
jgi:hypothetical protein